MWVEQAAMAQAWAQWSCAVCLHGIIDPIRELQLVLSEVSNKHRGPHNSGNRIDSRLPAPKTSDPRSSTFARHNACCAAAPSKRGDRQPRARLLDVAAGPPMQQYAGLETVVWLERAHSKPRAPRASPTKQAPAKGAGMVPAWCRNGAGKGSGIVPEKGAGMVPEWCPNGA